MIDARSRKKARSILAELLSDGITNYTFEDHWPTSEDAIIEALFDGLFAYYDDYPEVRLSASSFPEKVLVIMRRAMLFLDSQLEYEWPPFQFTWHKIPVLSRVLNTEARRNAAFQEFQKCGDFDVWPFFRESDFVQANNDFDVNSEGYKNSSEGKSLK